MTPTPPEAPAATTVAHGAAHAAMTAAVRTWLTGLQDRIVAGLETIDGGSMRRDTWTRPEGGGGISRLIEQGAVLERGGVLFSHVTGPQMPASATAHRPELAGRGWGWLQPPPQPGPLAAPCEYWCRQRQRPTHRPWLPCCRKHYAQ